MYLEIKKISKVAVIILGFGMISSPAFAVDYSTMTIDELSAMRGTMRDATVEDRDAFRSEWSGRVSSMTPEEKQELGSRMTGNRDGSGSRGGRGSGSQDGGGNRYGGGGSQDGGGNKYGQGGGGGRGGRGGRR